MKIAHKIPKKMAGRAFRRLNYVDLPKDLLAKDSQDTLKHPIAVAGFLFFGSYNALIWTVRNYETTRERLVIKPLAMLSFVILQSFTMLALFTLFSTFPKSWLIHSEHFATALNMMVLGSLWALGAAWEVVSFYLHTLPSTLLGGDTSLASVNWGPGLSACECDRVDTLAPPNYTSVTIITTALIYLAFMGTALIDGLRQRRARAGAWAAIAANKRFFVERGLKDHNTISVRDAHNRQYVFKTLRDDSAEFFQIDAPENRMILIFDEKSGAFTQWGKLRDLRPALADRLESKAPLPKGPPRRRAKFPRGPATKTSVYPFKRYGWSNKQ